MAALFLFSACGGSATPTTNASSPSPPGHSCLGLHFPYPPANASLKAEDNGRTISLTVGALVEVALVGSADRRWAPLRLSGSALTSLGTQAATATVGTQLNEYCASGRGSAVISSARDGESWSVTVNIS